MNERIKELALQAGLKQRIWNSLGKELPMWQEDPDNPGLEKFAELIVKECADIGDNYQEILGNEPECYNCRKVAYGIVDKIKQHFGVEE
jgi:hypothetical protein